MSNIPGGARTHTRAGGGMDSTDHRDDADRDGVIESRTFRQMLMSGAHHSREGLRFWRLCMVLGGFAPLFSLIALRGIGAVPDRWLWVACAALVVIPTVFLVLRLWSVCQSTSPQRLQVGRVDEAGPHILTYLFATLLPFYRQDIGELRDLVAVSLAVVFIVFLFWHLNLHYVNIFLAIAGFRIHTIRPRDDDPNPYTSRTPIIVVTRSRSLTPGGTIWAYRLSDTLYWSPNS